MQSDTTETLAKFSDKPAIEPQALSIKNTLSILGISKTLLWRSVASGRIKVIRLGRRTLIPTSEIKRLLGS